MKQKKENKQKRKKKYPIFSFKYLLFDFVKITGAIPTLIYFRPKIYRYGKKEKVKGAIMMSNHVGFLDPVVLLVCAGIRRIWSLAASDLFVKKSRAWFFKACNCIPVDRENVTIDMYHQIADVLSSNKLLAMFPEGKINVDNEAETKKFKGGIALFAIYVTKPEGSVTVFLGIFIAVQLLAFPFINKLIKTKNINKIYKFGLPLSVLALIFFAIFGSNLYIAYVCVFFVAVGFAGAQLTSWIMFPHTVDALELVSNKRQSGACSAIMTFTRKSSSALVIFLFSLVLQFTGYDSEAATQTIQAQYGIKFVMAFTCIIFMVFGFIMASRYSLTKEKNALVSKYLPLQREKKIEELSDEEKVEYEELKKSL